MAVISCQEVCQVETSLTVTAIEGQTAGETVETLVEMSHLELNFSNLKVGDGLLYFDDL